MKDIWNLDARKLGNKFIGSFCVMLEDTETLLTTMGQTEWLKSSISIRLRTVNSSTSYNTQLYTVELVDRTERIHHILALGMEKISGPLPEVSFPEGMKMEFWQR